MSHNMVVVDGKMQEPTSCDQFLFYSGNMMQVHAMSTDARWSNSPYLGGYDQIGNIKAGKAPYVPIVQGIRSREILEDIPNRYTSVA